MKGRHVAVLCSKTVLFYVGPGRFTEGSRKVSRKLVAIYVAIYVARHVASRFPTTATTKGRPCLAHGQRPAMASPQARFEVFNSGARPGQKPAMAGTGKVCRPGTRGPGIPEPRARNENLKDQHESRISRKVHGRFTEGHHGFVCNGRSAT